MANFDWKELGKTVAGLGLPILGGALGGPGGAALGGAIASAIGGDPTDPKDLVKMVKADPQAAVKLAEIEANTKVQLQQLITQQAIAEVQAESANAAQINETMRAEMQTQDNFRGRWRPFFGYMMAGSWGLTVAAVVIVFVYVVIENPKDASFVIKALGELMSSMGLMWSVALGVLGVNIRSRSQDKARSMGFDPGGVLSGMLNRR